MDKDFLNKYLSDFSELMRPDDLILDQLIEIKQALIDANAKGNKGLIFGNGGSAAIASHFSVDLTKNAKIKCLNFNEASFITCFANDYGYENWVTEAIKAYCLIDDLVILISSSGTSKNIVNAAQYCKDNNIDLITLSGFTKDNPLSTLGNVNFHIESTEYNYIEMSHHIILLALVDIFVKKLY